MEQSGIDEQRSIALAAAEITSCRKNYPTLNRISTEQNNGCDELFNRKHLKNEKVKDAGGSRFPPILTTSSGKLVDEKPAFPERNTDLASTPILTSPVVKSSFPPLSVNSQSSHKSTNFDNYRDVSSRKEKVRELESGQKRHRLRRQKSQDKTSCLFAFINRRQKGSGNKSESERQMQSAMKHAKLEYKRRRSSIDCEISQDLFIRLEPGKRKSSVTKSDCGIRTDTITRLEPLKRTSSVTKLDCGIRKDLVTTKPVKQRGTLSEPYCGVKGASVDRLDPGKRWSSISTRGYERRRGSVVELDSLKEKDSMTKLDSMRRRDSIAKSEPKGRRDSMAKSEPKERRDSRPKSEPRRRRDSTAKSEPKERRTSITKLQSVGRRRSSVTILASELNSLSMLASVPGAGTCVT